LNIDDGILEEVMDETGAATKTEAVRKALSEFIQRRKIEKLIALGGKVKFHTDWKNLRKGWSRNARGSR
jgi:hypothetical protein